MGNAYDDEFDDDLSGHDTDLVKQLRKQLRDKDKELTTLKDELGTLRTQTRTASLSELLEAKGVNPKAAKFYPSDLAVDEESLAKWLEGDGDLFAATSAPTQEQATEAEDETSGGDADQADVPEWARDYLRIQQQEQAGETVTAKSNPAKLQGLLAASQNAKSSTDFITALQSGQLG